MAQGDVSSSEVMSREWSAAQRAAVIEEMNSILTHPVFKGSNRCVDLLRYLVDCALADGDVGIGIKERTLGVEVFGRSPDYDVSTDPIVRRVASEIRKRLAQYYQERGSSHLVRIDLVRGSYLPEFEFATVDEHRGVAHVEDSDESPAPLKQLELETADPERAADSASKVRRKWVVGFAAAILVLAGLSLIYGNALRSPVYRVWKPLLDSGNTITVCLPIRDVPQSDQETAGPRRDTDTKASGQPPPVRVSPDTLVSTLFRDVNAGNNITTLLSNYKKSTDLRPATALKFRGLQQGPVVLIGGLNNPWVPILLSDLRYSVRYDPDSRDAWVEDVQNPTKRDWKIDGKLPSADIPADYAVVTRVFDQKTNQWIMALSGLQAKGTEAASRLVTDPNYVRLLPASISGKGNFQIVLETSVIGGEPGPIQVLAVHTW